MFFVFYVALFLGALASSQACTCLRQHPQGEFCRADFVIRAKVLSQEIEGSNRVFGLRILKTYKGATELNKTKDIQYYGSKQGSLFAKAYTPSNSATECGASLWKGGRYVIFGRIFGGKLRLSLCSFIQEWSKVLVNRVVRNGLKRFYGANCGCQISKCNRESRGECERMTGCVASFVRGGSYSCGWDHSYCVKNTNGSACSWHETAEYKNCLGEP